MRTETFLMFLGAGMGFTALAAWAAWRLWGPPWELDLDDEPPQVTRSLEGRIVFCANCEAKGVLYKSSSGELVCGLCGSPSWVFEIPRTRLVKREMEVKQLEHLWQLLPNDLPLHLRVQWVADVKRRAEAKISKAGERLKGQGERGEA